MTGARTVGARATEPRVGWTGTACSLRARTAKKPPAYVAPTLRSWPPASRARVGMVSTFKSRAHATRARGCPPTQSGYWPVSHRRMKRSRTDLTLQLSIEFVRVTRLSFRAASKLN
jgi:hypothetical protein